jgi:hypothetical protein
MPPLEELDERPLDELMPPTHMPVPSHDPGMHVMLPQQADPFGFAL